MKFGNILASGCGAKWSQTMQYMNCRSNTDVLDDWHFIWTCLRILGFITLYIQILGKKIDRISQSVSKLQTKPVIFQIPEFNTCILVFSHTVSDPVNFILNFYQLVHRFFLTNPNCSLCVLKSEVF